MATMRVAVAREVAPRFTFSKPVISHWTRLRMRSPHWSEALSVLHVECSRRGQAREVCMSDTKTAIVTEASQGIGAGLVETFLNEGYNVVATSLNTSQSLTASPSLVLVDGDIGKQETAAKAVEAAIQGFRISTAPV